MTSPNSGTPVRMRKEHVRHGRHVTSQGIVEAAEDAIFRGLEFRVLRNYNNNQMVSRNYVPI